MKLKFLFNQLIHNETGESAENFLGGLVAIFLAMIGLLSQCDAGTTSQSHQSTKVIDVVGPPPPPVDNTDYFIYWVVGVLFVITILVIWWNCASLSERIEKLVTENAEFTSRLEALTEELERLEIRQNNQGHPIKSLEESVKNHRLIIEKLKSCSPEYQSILAREKEEKALREAQAALLGGPAHV